MTCRVNTFALVALIVMLCGGVQASADEPKTATPDKALDDACQWLHAKAKKMIRASCRKMPNGVNAFPPQAGGGYEAFWLRDYAYQLEGCTDAFSDKELVESCRVFVNALRQDGAGVDCVKFSGQPIYQPGYGSMGANPVADGSQFTIDVAWHTWQKTKDRQLLTEIIDKLVKTMEAAPRNPQTGLVHIKPGGWDRCPYGFTDSVRKQGDELFCSLLYVQACRQLADLLAAANRPEDAKKWRGEGEKLTPVIRQTFWDEKIGLFRAATVLCKQPDIWGSAFAVYLDVATPEQAKIIARYFKDHYSEIVQCGQIRHLPGGVYWDAACGRNTYQNGGYWATATGWFVYTLDLVDPKLADQTVIDMVGDFRARGVSEWVLDKHLAVMNYLASATMPLAGVRKMLARRGTPLVIKAGTPAEEPNGPANLAYVGNGAKPATASSALDNPKHKAPGLNDGQYGNDHSWIPDAPHAHFQIELAKAAKIGRFKLGRDRLGQYTDRALRYLKIEVSLDARQWQTVFENKEVTSVLGYDPRETLIIQVAPVEAKHVKVTVDPVECCIDEFEVYAPAVAPPKTLPDVRVEGAPPVREMVVEKRYINLPVKTGGKKCRMMLTIDGRKVREFNIELAEGQPDFWAFIDAGAWKGKTLGIQAGRLPHDHAGLTSIDQTDQIKGAADLYKEKLRPQFHFSQKRGWNNDPNGMVYYDGQWHLFSQHNPYGWNWDNMHWGHAVSRDLVHWEELPIALYPWTMAKDHCYSGSAAMDPDNTSGFQTGKEKVMVAAFTDTGAGEAIAYSNDRGRTWTYWEGNPVVRHNGRDPYIFWYAPGKHWVMALYEATSGNFLAIYTSSDLKKWKFESKLPGYFECTNLFELPVDGKKENTRWVAFGGDAKYAIGSFDGKTFKPEHADKHQVHYGNFYASQVFNNAPDGRKVQIGWATIAMPGMPFNQMMTVPYELTLRTTAEGVRMFAEPVKELEKLRGKGQVRESFVIQPGKPLEVPVQGQLLDIRAEFEMGKATGFGMTMLGRWVGYDVAGKALNGVPLVPVDGKIRLRLLVDRSSLEVCGNDGRVNLTTPFTASEKDHTLQFKSDGAATKLNKLEIHELRSVWE